MKLIAALFLLAASLSADATNYYRWGWEDTRPSWGVNGRATNAGCYFTNPAGACGGSAPAGSSSARDCTVSHSGSCSMKMVVIGNDGGNQGLGYDQIATLPGYPFNIIGSVMYYRWWMRIDTGFNWGTSAAGKKVKSNRIAGSAGGLRVYTGYLYKDRISIAECDPTCKLNTGVTASDGEIRLDYDFAAVADSVWREYVVKVKANTVAACTAGTDCDAQLCLWVDNASQGCYSNWKLWATDGSPAYEQWGAWMVRPYWQLAGSASDGGTVYIDDVSVDTAYNSSIALPKPTNPSVSSLDQFMRYSVASYRHLGRYAGVLL